MWTVAFRTTEEFYFALFDMSAVDRATALSQFAAGRAALSPAERELFDRAMYRSEPDTLVSRLKADITARRLPAVSWLVPTAALSEHPGASTPVGSANLIYQVLDVLASDRDTWSKTVLLVNFDENDGYFDHVPAPVPPVSSSSDWYDGKPLGLGPRVPMTVVSPWTVGGHVCSEVADHTSVLRFLERWTGVEEPNISTWRRTVCGDLTSAFDFSGGGRAPVAGPAGPGAGTGVAVASHAAGDPDAAGTGAGPPAGKGAAVPAVGVGAPVRHGSDPDPRRRRPGLMPLRGVLLRGCHRPHPCTWTWQRRSVVRLPAGGEWVVQGPNRFWYELSGTAPVDVMFRNGSLDLVNYGRTTITLRVHALRYGTRTSTVRLRAGQHRSLPWATDNGWYDLEVTAPGFRRRLTGRVEDGRPGTTA